MNFPFINNTTKVFGEITSSKMIIRENSISEIEYLVNSIYKEIRVNNEQEKLISCQPKKKNIVFPEDMLDCFDNPDTVNSFEEDSILVLPIIGTMFKYGYWWYPGMDMYADMIRYADKTPQIIGTILLVNTPGGTTQSVIQMEDALRNRIKPCVTLVDGQCCSGGIYVSVLSDKILAMNSMCEIGSVGTFATIRDDSKMWETYGIKYKQIYPPESSFKNKDVRDALKGDDKYMIDSSLTPYAKFFQNLVSTNRPKLKADYTPGILEGAVLYASDAKACNLIDDIMNMEGAIELVTELSRTQQNIYSQFKFN